MNEFENKTWKKAFYEVEALHLRCLKKQEEILIEKLIKQNGKFGITTIEFDYDHTWITDPTVDESGRFEVNPVEYYKESYINALEKLLK
jgi:hypothetical protein